jgi:DNA-binding beta-propeller fold protein YncE
VPAGLKKVRSIDENEDLFGDEYFAAGDPKLTGVAFPPGAHTLRALNQPPGGGATLTLVAPPKNPTKDKVSKTPIELSDPINTAFDGTNQGAEGYGMARLFLLDAKLGTLATVKAGDRDVMDPATLKHTNIQPFGLTDPQGMTLDPTDGQLFILDGQHIVRLKPTHGRKFNGAEVAWVNLPDGLGKLRGIAFNPSNGHLYVLSAGEKKLHELTLDGELVASLYLSGLGTGSPQGMVFAPSLDQTDPLSIFHLYMVMANGSEGEVTEWALSGQP